MLKYLFAKEDNIPQGTAAIFFGVSSIAWFIIGTGLGSFNAAKLAFPDLFHGLYALQFGSGGLEIFSGNFIDVQLSSSI